jgi:hypothetical protein
VPEFHAEPYLYVAGLSHRSVLVAWGAFYFRTRPDGPFKLVEADDLQWVHPPRRETIGARSAPYGPARVEVFRLDGTLAATASTNTANHCWVAGLEPDTPYTYVVRVKNDVWAQGERWDWDSAAGGLRQQGMTYRTLFRTLPDPSRPLDGPFTFAVIGDFGSGIRRPSTSTRRQAEVAAALARAVDAHDVRLILTTGDNIYASQRFLLWTRDTGEDDDDWFFTYFQPYRYALARVPVYPSIGNHDTAEMEEHDDREQVMDNFYLRERLAADEAAGRASLGPGLFYRFRVASDVEFVCIDTSKEDFFRFGRLFEHPRHLPWLETAFPAGPDGVAWRIPFGHHPPYCAGPRHHNTDGMAGVVALFERSGVRASFSGHEHNFQHAHARGIDYFVSGAGSKIRQGRPDDWDGAFARSWAAECHFLLVTIDGGAMTVRAIAGTRDGTLVDVVREDVHGARLTGPIVVA